MDLSQRLKERRFPAVLVKTICDRAYGDKPHRDTWRNWRVWAGVRSGARSYSFDQLCDLFTIAYIRSNPENRYRELSRSEVQAIAQSIETQEMIANFIAWFDQNFVVGKDAAIALQSRGMPVSTRSLYRNVPRFNINAVYDVQYLERLARA